MNKIFNYRFFLLFILLSSVQIFNAQVKTEFIDKPIYMHYMPWFDSPEYNSNWGGHWSMATMNPNNIIDAETGKREIASHYYPLIGPYDSQDPHVIEYHILLMKYSGVDGLLINWYGEIGTNGDIDVLLENSNAIVNVADELSMSFSVIMEDRFVGNENGLNPVDYVYINIEYLKSNYFPKSNFIRGNLNQPFLGIFGPININDEASWDYAMTAAGEDVIFLPLYWDKHKVGQNADGGYDWVNENGVTNTNYFYESIAPTLDLAMGCAYPGFEDFYEEGGWGSNLFFLDPNDGALLNQTIDLAITNVDLIDALQLITWNDFGEGTMFEPTYEFGFQRLTILQDQLGVQFSEYELQQIYRLYKLRKTYRNNQDIQTSLDQSKDYFLNYQLSEAVSIMDDIEAEDNDKLFYIKSRYNGQYLYQDNNMVKCGNLELSDSYKWKMELANDGFYYIKNALSNATINIENQTGNLECTNVSADAWSSMWEKRTIDGTHLRFLNRWIRNQYINIENETENVRHIETERLWLSGHFILEEVENPLNILEHNASNISVFPNPSTDLVTVKCVNSISNFKLYDIAGNMVTVNNQTYYPNMVTFSVKHLKTGIYLLVLDNNERIKFIKN